MRRSFRCLDKPREVRDRSLALFDCRRLDEPDNDALSMREVVGGSSATTGLRLTVPAGCLTLVG